MVKTVVIVLIAVTIGFAEVQTENSVLDRKANSADFFLIQNGSEFWYKAFTQTIPYSNRELYQLPEFDTYRLYGKEYSVFKALPQSKLSRIQTGNEVGDPLFQELDENYETESNRTPMTELILYTPEMYGWKLFGGLEQVDHFCSGDMAYKKKLLDRQNETFDASPYAWFGENYPQYSSLIAGGTKTFKKGSAQFSHRSGWLWLNLKGSGRLLPYKNRVSQVELTVNNWRIASRFNWKRYLGDDTLRHYSSYTTDYMFEYHSHISKQTTHRIGVDMSLRGNNEIIEYASPYIVIPYALFEYSDKKSLTLKNTLSFNGTYFLLRDSLMIRTRDTLSGAGFSAYVTNQINPRDDYRELPTIGYSDTTQIDHQKLMHMYSAEGFFGESIGMMQWQIYASPWMVLNPHYFSLIDTVSDSGYILRKGSYTSHNGYAWGLKSSVKTLVEPVERVSLSGNVQLQRYWGSARSSLDFLESELSAIIAASYRTSLNLELSVNSIFMTRRYLNNWGPEPVEISGGWEHNVSLKQLFFDEKLSLWFSALNIGASELKEHPNGAFDRFRLIAGMSWVL